jgi:hypothetical protein
MRARIPALILGVYLLAALAGCSSKPTGANGANNPGDSAAPSPTATMSPPAEDSKAAAKIAPLPPAVVPSGTPITVRLAQAVGSKISEPGQAFSATVATPVEVSGQTVIPAGATASGTVVDAKPLGHFAGGARLQLQLGSINVNGNDQPVRTSSLVRVMKGKGKRTGIMAGGGAGLGAIIGGLAGGGKGAVIGALAGGGAGTAGGALTGNKEIVLPAESAVTFRLVRPLEIK